MKTWRQLRSAEEAAVASIGGKKKSRSLLRELQVVRQGRLRWENIEMAAMAVADNEVESDDENVSSMPIYMIGDQV